MLPIGTSMLNEDEITSDDKNDLPIGTNDWLSSSPENSLNPDLTSFDEFASTGLINSNSQGMRNLADGSITPNPAAIYSLNINNNNIDIPIESVQPAVFYSIIADSLEDTWLDSDVTYIYSRASNTQSENTKGLDVKNEINTEPTFLLATNNNQYFRSNSRANQQFFDGEVTKKSDTETSITARIAQPGITSESSIYPSQNLFVTSPRRASSKRNLGVICSPPSYSLYLLWIILTAML